MAELQHSRVASWLMQLEPRTRTEVEQVTGLIEGADPRLTHDIKWGRLTFAVDDNWHHWLCGIAVTRKANNLVFHKGTLLEDPEQLLSGDGRYVRHLPLSTATKHPSAVVQLVRSAVDHETDALD